MVDQYHLRFFWIEISIVLITFILLIVVFNKWRKKKGNLTKLLLIFFTLYGISILISAFTKYWWYGLDSVGIAEDTYLYVLIDESRFQNMVVLAANLVFQQFYLEIFRKNRKKSKYDYFIQIFICILILIQFIPSNEDIVAIIIGALLLLQSLLLYFPVMINSYKTQRKIQEQIRYAFYFLFLIALSFCLVWVLLLCDEIWDMIMPSGFGPFYYFSMLFIVVCEFFSYLGYVMPKWLKKKLEISDEM
jgi:hypothetical protein